MKKTDEEKEALFDRTIQLTTGEIMKFPAFARGNVLADVEFLADGDKERQSFLLALVYGTFVSGVKALPHAGDEHERGIVTGNLPLLIESLHHFAEEKRKTDITIKNLSGALAILNGQEEGK